MSFIEQPQFDPYYDDRTRMCWHCNEPIVTGFLHICGHEHTVDDIVEDITENSKGPRGEAM